MGHLTDGALRRLYDEPLALEEEDRAHYDRCPECRARFASVAEDARHAVALMAVPGATVDADAALSRVKAAAASAPRRGGLSVLSGLGWRKPAVAGLIAASLAATLAFTPLGASVVQVFEPAPVQPVTISESDLHGLDALSGWGDVKQTGTSELKEAGSAEEAASSSGLPVLRVDSRSLPAAVAAAPVSYGSVGQVGGTVTFTDKAPAKLHGTTLTVKAGPAEAAVYGDLSRAQSAAGQAKTPQDAASALGPTLVVVAARAPQVSSTGASVADIKAELLTQPGLSDSVKTYISSIDSPTGNLPIPIPAEYAKASSVDVQGVKGTLVGDNTGLGAGVIFIKNGVVYAVGGTVTQQDVLAVANRLQTR